MTTDISEKGLEGLIVRAMTGRTDLLMPPHTPTGFDAPVAGGTGWLLGDPKHYDRGFCVDLVQLRGFLESTQPKAAAALEKDIAHQHNLGSKVCSPRLTVGVARRAAAAARA